MLEKVKESLSEIPEHRTGKNWTYKLADAGLAAFGVFNSSRVANFTSLFILDTGVFAWYN
jgi:hypothetical protein